MAAELVTPVDELSGLPLPIIPPDEPLDRAAPDTDWHHHFHPRTSLHLKDLGGEAIRNVRLQLSEYHTHHHLYHNFFSGPPLPQTSEDKFISVIMSAAGYIPSLGLSFGRRHGFQVVNIEPLVPEQAHRLRTQELRVGSPAVIGKFLRAYIFGTDVLKDASGQSVREKVAELNINDTTIEEFITTTDLERRRVLGYAILTLATEKATEPLAQQYRMAWQRQSIAPGLPPSAKKFTRRQLGSRIVRERIVQQLRERLAA